MSNDKILNRLYKQIEKIAAEDSDNVDEMMRILDKIYARRVKIGEIDE